MNKVFIYDTTLRDGTQGEGISLSVEDKLKITKKLDLLGVDYIEGGWPGSNPKDMDFFKEAVNLKLKNATLTAFGSTRHPSVKAEEDGNLNAFIASGVKVVTIFGKSWDFHVKEALKVSLNTNLEMIKDSIAYLKKNKMRVFYDAEHFFDGYKANSKYAIETLLAAQEAGAENLNLCDTNGGSLPHEIYEIVEKVLKLVNIPIGIHTHNDSNLGVANALEAVRAGARIVQGTISGVGERCGNGNLLSIIPNLELKMNFKTLKDSGILKLTEYSKYLSELMNINIKNNEPFVGNSAFAHKGGIHVSAVLRNPKTYEHISPESVGNTRRVLVSELSGGSNISYKIKELGIDFTEDKETQRKIIKKIKEMEYDGYQFEGADGSFELLLEKELGRFMPTFNLESFNIHTSKNGRESVNADASIKIRVGDKEFCAKASGDGPVNALDKALRKALDVFYPSLKETHLIDYKVRVLDGKEATSSKVRVLIETADSFDSWTTIGVSTDIIEASWIALVDSITYKLMKDLQKK